MKYTNYDNIDKVIKRFHEFLPEGGNFYDGIYDLNFDYNEQTEILKFLVDTSILEIWGGHGQHILTDIGESIVDDYGGIEKYLAHRQKEINESKRLEKVKTEKLISDAKLSKWQVKIFWPMFIIALIGGLYSIYSIIDLVVGESEEQKIERILDLKLQEREQKQKASNDQLNIDTLSIYMTDEKNYIYS